MTNNDEILKRAKGFFIKHIAENHKKNTEKLIDIKEFNINPFTHAYISNFVFGNSDPENLAKALLYPRIMGTSISTTFGNQLQYFCNEVLDSYASVVQGIDIEFIDAIDKRKKFCQLKAGPTTINKDDVETICGHFKKLSRLAKTNKNKILNPSTDCVVGVFYGDKSDLSQNYRKIDEQYEVYCGKEFWHHLTGDIDFYDKLVDVFASAAEEINGKALVDEVIQELSKELKK